MTTARRLVPSLALALALALVAACGSGSGPAGSGAAGSGSPAPSSVDLPTGAPAGGGSSGSSGSGVLVPTVPSGPADPTGGGAAQLVRPRPGQHDPHPVAPIRLEASVDGRHVLVKVTWYSGVEPCTVLDSIRLERSGSAIAITPLEGAGDLTVACIDIAVLKATIVDLGELQPGTWRITAPTGDAAPLELTIT